MDVKNVGGIVKRYKTIVIDPPWQYGVWGKANPIIRPNSIVYNMPYSTMTINEIKDPDTDYWDDNILIIKGDIVVPKLIKKFTNEQESAIFGAVRWCFEKENKDRTILMDEFFKVVYDQLD